MTKQDAIELAIYRHKKDNRQHKIYNSHMIDGYFVDNYEYGYTIYRIIGQTNK